jgi:hypothetical protein
LTANEGDIDLLGFEDGLSLKEKDQILQRDSLNLTGMVTRLEQLKPEEDILRLSSEDKLVLCTRLQEGLCTVSKLAHDIRAIKEKKEFAKSKCIERGGSNWRQSKFVYVISALKAILYDIECFLRQYMDILQRTCLTCSTLNNSQALYARGDIVNLSSQGNYKPLDDNMTTDDPRLIKQRSEEWHAIRKEANVTGSTMYQGLGLDGLKRQKEHFDKVVCGVPEKEKTPAVQKLLDYGTKHEIDAMATLVGKVMPVLYPDLTYYEEGCIPIYVEGKHVMVVSPDGSIRERQSTSYEPSTTRVGVDIKCPVFKPHTEVPKDTFCNVTQKWKFSE